MQAAISIGEHDIVNRAGSERNFPPVPIRITEVTAVSAPLPLDRFGDRFCSYVTCGSQDFIDLSTRTDVVREG